jgi:hypothetical protein
MDFDNNLNELMQKFFNYIIEIIKCDDLKTQIKNKYEIVKQNKMFVLLFLMKIDKNDIDKQITEFCEKYNIDDEQHISKIKQFYELFIDYKNLMN